MDHRAVPIIVLAKRPERCEAINSILRNAGHAAHCTWKSTLREFKEQLEHSEPYMIVIVGDDSSLDDVVKISRQCETQPSVVLVTAQTDEEAIADAMLRGARDVVSMTQTDRLSSVLQRELRSSQLERSLKVANAAVEDFQRQLQTLIENSPDAMSLVQEGIILQANAAWLELFGFAREDDLIRQPLLDLFLENDHEALKGAVTACQDGKWIDHAVRVAGIGNDDGSLSLDLRFELAEHEGEPAVRIRVAPAAVGQKTTRLKLENASSIDPVTNIFSRAYFLNLLSETLKQSNSGGVRAFAYIKPDKFGKVSADIGPYASDELLREFAQLLKHIIHPNDLHGRLGGNLFGILLNRGNQRDVEAWANAVCEKVAENIFEISDKSISLTCTIGIVMAESEDEEPSELVSNGQRAHSEGRRQGGNRVYVHVPDKTDTTSQRYDKVWVRHIKSALMENRFRLVHQPIANLQGETQGMYDVFVRMLDERDNEVLPSEFLPAAERNKLMKNIDRWVVGAALAMCAAKKPTRLFVRLSGDSVKDRSLSKWLRSQLDASGADPDRVCFQVTEEVAYKQMKETKRLVTDIFQLGFKFAIEHFGIGPQPVQVISHLPIDYVKIDGSLMQGLSLNQTKRNTVAELLQEAKTRNIATIAERVEDANTIAVLWQLGLQFMQGHYVQEPEIIIEDDSGIMQGLGG